MPQNQIYTGNTPNKTWYGTYIPIMEHMLLGNLTRP
jgi:hypothetical protein